MAKEKSNAEFVANIEAVPIASVKLNDKNPRTIRDEKFNKLVQSVKEFPQMLRIRPIVVDENNVALGGNMRLRACIEAGLKEVYIIRAGSLTEEQKQRFIISDNVGYGEWDWDALANEWDADDLDSWGVDAPVYGDTNTGGDGQDTFSDEGILPKNAYGVIIMCESEADQKKVFDKMQSDGYTCKIVVV